MTIEWQATEDGFLTDIGTLRAIVWEYDNISYEGQPWWDWCVIRRVKGKLEEDIAEGCSWNNMDEAKNMALAIIAVLTPTTD